MDDRSRILKALIFPVAWIAQIGGLVGSVVFAVHVNVANAHFVFDLTASAPQAVGSGQIDVIALSGGLGRLGSFGFTGVATGVDTQSAGPVIYSVGSNDPVPGPDVVLPTRESCEAAREYVMTIAAALEAGRMFTDHYHVTWAHTASLEPLEESDFSPQYEPLPSMPIRRREITGA